MQYKLAVVTFKCLHKTALSCCGVARLERDRVQGFLKGPTPSTPKMVRRGAPQRWAHVRCTPCTPLLLRHCHHTIDISLTSSQLRSSDLEARGRLCSTTSSSYVVQGCRLSATELFRSQPQLASGTNYHVTPRLRTVPATSFLTVDSRSIFPAVSFPTLCSACEVTCVVIGHFSRLPFVTYLRTHVLTYLPPAVA